MLHLLAVLVEGIELGGTLGEMAYLTGEGHLAVQRVILLLRVVAGLGTEEGYGEATVYLALVEVVLHDTYGGLVEVELPTAALAGLSLQYAVGTNVEGAAGVVEHHVLGTDTDTLVATAEDTPLGELDRDILDVDALPGVPVALSVGIDLRRVVGLRQLLCRGHGIVVTGIRVVEDNVAAGRKGPVGQVFNLELVHVYAANPVVPRLLDGRLDVDDRWNILCLAVNDALQVGDGHGNVQTQTVELVGHPRQVAAVVGLQGLCGRLERHGVVARRVLDLEVREQGHHTVLWQERVIAHAESGCTEDEHIIVDDVGLRQGILSEDVHDTGLGRHLDAGQLELEVVGQFLTDILGQTRRQVEVGEYALGERLPLVLSLLEAGVVLAQLEALGNVVGAVAHLVLQFLRQREVAPEIVKTQVGEESVDGLLCGVFLVFGGILVVGDTFAVEDDIVGIDHELVELHGHTH